MFTTLMIMSESLKFNPCSFYSRFSFSPHSKIHNTRIAATYNDKLFCLALLRTFFTWNVFFFKFAITVRTTHPLICNRSTFIQDQSSTLNIAIIGISGPARQQSRPMTLQCALKGNGVIFSNLKKVCVVHVAFSNYLQTLTYR